MEKQKERIVLRCDQQTTIAIALDRKDKSRLDPGDAIAVASSAGTILNARYNPETGVVDVVPIEGAQGQADVSVTIKLADGTILPPQVVEYDVVHPDAEAVKLTPGSIGEKKTIITNPEPNAEPHVIPEEKKPEPAKAAEPEKEKAVI